MVLKEISRVFDVFFFKFFLGCFDGFKGFSRVFGWFLKDFPLFSAVVCSFSEKKQSSSQILLEVRGKGAKPWGLFI